MDVFEVFAEKVEGRVDYQAVNFGDVGWKKVKKVGVII